MKEIYKDRLKILANWLIDTSDETFYNQNKELVYVYDPHDPSSFFEARYFGWALMDLPWMFDEWKYISSIHISPGPDHTGAWIELPAGPYSGNHIDLHSSGPFNAFTVASFMDFFGIEIELFLHFFSEQYQQPERFGGTIYKDRDEIEAKDIGQNILNYLSNEKEGKL